MNSRRGSSAWGRLGPILVVLGAVVLILGLGFANVIPGFHLAPSAHPPGGGAVSTPVPPTFRVTFTETGLSPAASWSVSFAGSSQSSVAASIVFYSENGTFPYSVTPVSGFDPTPASGTLTVRGANLSESISFSSTSPANFTVTFTEHGLPVSTSWSVTLGGAERTSTLSTLAFAEPNGSFSYSVSPVSGFSAQPSSGSLLVSGNSVGVTIAFTALPPPGTYPISFLESGLAAGTLWTVTLNGTLLSSSSPSIWVNESNGSYSYSVGTVRGYIEAPSSGVLTVNGEPLSVPLVFTNSTPPSHGSEFPVTFSTSGLSSDAQWAILMFPGPGPYGYNSTEFGVEAQGSSLSVGLPNGTYAWYLGYNPSGFLPNATNGTITVAGHPVNRTISFQLLVATVATYAVTFTETGLPAGGTWYATANVTSSSAPTGSPVGFQIPNGTYSYNVSASAPGYSTAEGADTFFVDGGPVRVAVQFEAVYNVTFLETGVSNATSWVVDVNGSEFGTSAGFSIVYPLFNGTYAYSAWAPGYSALPASGTLTVAGTPQNVSIAFQPAAAYTVQFTESGLPNGSFWLAELVLNGTAFDNGSFAAGSMANISAGPGNYTWLVDAEPFSGNYVATPSSGGIQILAAGVQVSVDFTPVGAGLQVVQFSEEDTLDTGEHGVPNGTSWNVTIGGVTETTSGMLLTFLEPNGTYEYSIGGPPGYVPLPSFGTLTLDAATQSSAFSPAVSVYVAFVPGTPAPPLPPPEAHPGGHAILPMAEFDSATVRRVAAA